VWVRARNTLGAVVAVGSSRVAVDLDIGGEACFDPRDLATLR
jgi:hypothetical protein